MAKYKQFDFERIRRYSTAERQSKVGTAQFAQPFKENTLAAYLEGLPRILAAEELRILIRAIREAKEKKKPIVWGFGGHVIKVGLAPVLIELMDHGFITALATNGSGAIHDFEIAAMGQTSEDVDRELGSGRFGMAEETARMMNRAISKGAAADQGLGESLGTLLSESELTYPEQSVLLQAFLRDIPLTVHVALGTDIIHCHPEASGEAIGTTSLTDFKILVETISRLGGGGVYLNLGSAVILPEVFLKAVTIARSAGIQLDDFVTANLDFIQHYRPRENVVRRPVLGSGKGISLTGHHEIMIPLLAGLLITKH
jgi:hypothetical protein